MGAKEFFIECHMSVFDMSADEAFKSMNANFFLVGIGGLPRFSTGRFRACAGGCDRQAGHKVRPLDCQRLDNLPAQRKTYRVTARHFQIFQQPRAILGELLDGVAVIRLSAIASAATIENDCTMAL